MPANAASLIAIAAASVEVVSDGVPKKRIQLMPIGTIVLRDGRGPFNMSMEVAHAVVAATRAHAGKTDIMVDYDHQSFFGAVEGVGGRAPAAGWISPASLSVQDDGIWADVSWTPAAEAKLAAREYRYLSPLFTYDPATHAIRAIRNAGLVNTPAIDELAAVASVNPNLDPKLETPMSLSKIAVTAGLLAGATEDEIVAHVTGLVAASAAIAAASQQLGLKADATADEMVAAASAKADPAKFVPIAVVTELQGQVATLTKKDADRSADEVVAAALKASKISPKMKSWADDYARKDLAGFQAYVAAAPAMIAAGELLAGELPQDVAGSKLASSERTIAANLGVTEEKFIANKTQEG